MAMHIEVGGPAHLYFTTLPRGADAVGVIRRDGVEPAALLRFRRSGEYAQMIGDTIRPLDRGEVVSAMRYGIVSRLDPTEPITTPERFAEAAKIAARAVQLARGG
jgi:hypothetical protein